MTEVNRELVGVRHNGPRDGAIYAAMSAVMDEIEAIGKDRRNEQQNFNFRGIDQVYNAVHPLMAKHKIFTVPRVLQLLDRRERQTRSGGVITFTLILIEYDFVSGEDGSYVTVGPMIGEGMDSADKGANKAQAVAHKYAVFQTFLVPTEQVDDPDADTYDVAPEAAGPAPDAFDDWGDAPTDKSPEPAPAPSPAKKKVVKKKVAKKAAAKPRPPAPEPEPDLKIEDEQSAHEVTDLLIQLASMHDESVKSLLAFWTKNAKPIDHLDQNYPDEFARLKDAFTQLKGEVRAKKSEEGQE